MANTEPMLTAHKAQHKRIGAVLLVRGRTCPFVPQLRKLGFSSVKRSGKRADGGPGHVVPRDYYVPWSRWQHNELLRAAVHLLFKQANNAPFAEIEAAQVALSALVKGNRTTKLQGCSDSSGDINRRVPQGVL
jgi:hypothetical protein